MPMALIHVSFNHQRKKFLSETDLTHTAAVYAMPCKYNTRHMADTLTHHNCATNEATSFRLNILKPWSKELSNDMLLSIMPSNHSIF